VVCEWWFWGLVFVVCDVFVLSVVSSVNCVWLRVMWGDKVVCGL
jgi:hypothetical protein